MAKIIQYGVATRTVYVPEGWQGQCPKCLTIVETELHDLNLGDEHEYLVGCPLPGCDGRVPVVYAPSYSTNIPAVFSGAVLPTER